MQENEKLNPEELNVSSIKDPNALGLSPDELEVEEKIMEGVEELIEEDLDVKSYLKVTPTLYIKAVPSEEGEEDKELFKILNPETQEVEVRELTDDEKKELYIKQLKESRRVFNPVKHNGNKTTNQFGSKYKQKRKRRNKLAKASRKANR
jgi:glutaredoxin